MRFNKAMFVPALAGALALGACAGEEEPVVDPIDPVVEPGFDPVDQPAAPVVAPAAGVFDPALDVNADGILGEDEGLGDADADGILDRDEVYMP